MRRAKIVATIGPSSQDPAVLKKMIQAGMDVARLNFSHGSHAEYLEIIRHLRALSAELGKPVTILQDLQGPKFRVGKLQNDLLELIPGQIVRLVNQGKAPARSPSGGMAVIPMQIPDPQTNLIPGKLILLDDGRIGLKIIANEKTTATAEVITGGVLLPNKGINLPGAKFDLKSLTKKDLDDLKFGMEMGVDALALSFVRSANDIKRLHKVLEGYRPRSRLPFIIAKLEKPEAIRNLDEILDIADGVMVARGDLAVETSPEEVPVMQKEIINAANRHGKLVITATQMLESMMHSPRPTRAEASDVANAIFDGTDAIMLSGETAVGDYPVETIRMMDAIVTKAESNFERWGHFSLDHETPAMDDAISTTRAARELAYDRDVTKIVVFTVSGKSGLLMSKAHPSTQIIAFTSEESTYYRLSMFWGVIPILGGFVDSVEELISQMEISMLEHGWAKKGEQIVVVCGYPVGLECPPNLALLQTIRASGCR